jgi:hypothetical protein
MASQHRENNVALFITFLFVLLFIAFTTTVVFLGKLSLLTQKSSSQAAELTGIPYQGYSRFEPPNGKVFFGMGQEIDNPAIGTNRYATETQPGICSVYSKNGVRPRLLSGYIGLKTPTGLSDILNRFEVVNSKEGNYYVPVIFIKL